LDLTIIREAQGDLSRFGKTEWSMIALKVGW